MSDIADAPAPLSNDSSVDAGIMDDAMDVEHTCTQDVVVRMITAGDTVGLQTGHTRIKPVPSMLSFHCVFLFKLNILSA